MVHQVLCGKELSSIGILAFAIILLYKICGGFAPKKISGILDIPGGLPVFGHLLQLGDDQPKSFEKIWKTYNVSTFQVRLGNTRAVVLNSFDDCRRMYIMHQSSVIDRPVPHTIETIATTKGLTIGTSPWNESTKRRRKVAGTALSRPKLVQYREILDRESRCSLQDLFDMSRKESEISVSQSIQQLGLNSTLTLCHGVQMDEDFQEIAKEILEVGHGISRLRGTSENLQDYIPLMRYLPRNSKSFLSKDLRDRRDKYLESFLTIAKERFERGELADCIYSAILQDRETKLSKDEISTVCLSLVSGEFETVPSTIACCIGSLSTPAGQNFQEHAIRDIKRFYPTMEEAWDKCLIEEKVPYVNANVKEPLRYYTVLPLGQPRKTSEKFPPIPHFSDYNTTKTALVAVPPDFRLKLRSRDENVLEKLLAAHGSKKN